MNTTAGYVVSHQYETIPFTKTLFTHPNLLTARKLAMSHAETLLAELWQRGDYETTITVHLVAAEEEYLTVDSPAVALVYELDMPITKPVLTREEALIAFDVTLQQLHQEFLFYQAHNYSLGFGGFHTEIDEPDSTPRQYIYLYDAMGYVSERASSCASYGFRPGQAGINTLSTFDDFHDQAPQPYDALIS